MWFWIVENPELFMGALGIAAAGFELWRRSWPKVGVRWYMEHTGLGVGIFNDGGRTTRVDVRLEGLDEVRSTKKGTVLLKQDRFPVVLRAGEEVRKEITSPFLANWVEEECDVPDLVVRVEYRGRWGRRITRKIETLAWRDFFKQAFPDKTVQEVLGEQMPKLVKELVQIKGPNGLSGVKHEMRMLREGLCRGAPLHDYVESERPGGQRYEQCPHCYKLRYLTDG